MNAPKRKAALSGSPDVLTVMAGNTRTVAVRWSVSGKVTYRGGWPTDSGGHALAREILAAVRNNRTVFVLAGVVPNVVDELDRYVKATHRPPASCIPLRFRRSLPCPLRIRPRPAKRVGDDRLAAALGALAIDPCVPWVVVDAGTALTVNAVRPPGKSEKAKRPARRMAGVFEGGLIVPGEQLALSALRGGTAQLPALKPMAFHRIALVWGRSTEEAIRFGVRRAQIAAVVGLVRAQAEVLGARTRIAVTGGGAAALWPVLRVELRSWKPVFTPDLVHHGLRFAFVTASDT